MYNIKKNLNTEFFNRLVFPNNPHTKQMFIMLTFIIILIIYKYYAIMLVDWLFTTSYNEMNDKMHSIYSMLH